MVSNKVQTFVEVYESLKRHLKWKVPDNRVMMTIASFYVMNKKDIYIESYEQLAEALKKQAGFFSPMRSHSRYTLAALLDIHENDAYSSVPRLFEVYEKLRSAKFSQSVPTFLTAFLLMNHTSSEENINDTIIKVKSMHDKMKKEHFFLTNADDYPLAALLTLEGQEGMIETMENYYEGLAKQKFNKGNNLQFLSHILTLSDIDDQNQLIEQVVTIADNLKSAGIKPKPDYYPVIGMLSLLPPEEVNVEEIVNIYDHLKAEKHFKRMKDMNVVIAAAFFVEEKIEQPGVTETSLYTILESILQAQQAVMIAAIGATAVATSNNN